MSQKDLGMCTNLLYIITFKNFKCLVLNMKRLQSPFVDLKVNKKTGRQKIFDNT